jgi:hypothetical protein
MDYASFQIGVINCFVTFYSDGTMSPMLYSVRASLKLPNDTTFYQELSGHNMGFINPTV